MNISNFRSILRKVTFFVALMVLSGITSTLFAANLLDDKWGKGGERANTKFVYSDWANYSHISVNNGTVTNIGLIKYGVVWPYSRLGFNVSLLNLKSFSKASSLTASTWFPVSLVFFPFTYSSPSWMTENLNRVGGVYLFYDWEPFAVIEDPAGENSGYKYSGFGIGFTPGEVVNLKLGTTRINIPTIAALKFPGYKENAFFVSAELAWGGWHTQNNSESVHGFLPFIKEPIKDARIARENAKPRISSIGPEKLILGDSLEVLGENFTSYGNGTSVTFGNLPGEITSITDDKMVIRISSGIQTGDVPVKVKTIKGWSNTESIIVSKEDDSLPAVIQELCQRRKTSVFWGRVTPRIVPELIKQINDNDNCVRVQSAHVLTVLGPEANEAIPVLIDNIADPNSLVAQAIAGALIKIGEQAIAPLAQRLDLAPEFKGEVVYTVLQKLDGANPALKRYREREEAARILQKKKEEAVKLEAERQKKEKEAAEKMAAEEVLRQNHRAMLNDLDKVASYVDKKGCDYALAIVFHPYGDSDYRNQGLAIHGFQPQDAKKHLINTRYLCVAELTEGAGTINERSGCAIGMVDGDNGKFLSLGRFPIPMLEGQSCSKKSVTTLLNLEEIEGVPVNRLARCATSILESVTCPMKEMAASKHPEFIVVLNKFNVPLHPDTISLDSIRAE